MQYQIKSLIGQRFGYLTITDRAPSVLAGDKWRAAWKAHCVCGTEVIVQGVNLRSKTRGPLKSCGCRRSEMLLSAWGTHGMSKHPAFAQWQGAIQRCTNENAPDWGNYGARGIRMCEAWLHSFKNFWADMGATYQPGLQLDRRNNDGPYAPENCRWATRVEQANNRRTNVFVETPLGPMTVAQAARHYGLKAVTLRQRMRLNWPADRLFQIPTPKKRSSTT